MKALTISQPYASLIVSGTKWIENRTWPTSYRGELAIHAGKGTQYLSRDELAKYPSGCVIAIAKLTACVSMQEIFDRDQVLHRRHHVIKETSKTWSQAARHTHASGPWCWILEDVQPVEPIYIAGKQGLWSFDGELQRVFV